MSFILLVLMAFRLSNLEAQAPQYTSRELAKKLYVSLTGTQPSALELTFLADKMAHNKADAARDIIDQKGDINNGGAFYSVTIKDWATPKFNKQKTTLAPLNDGTATIIGMIRDERPFNTILYQDVMYKATGVTFKGGQLWYFDTAYPSVPGVVSSTLCSAHGTIAGQYKIIFTVPGTSNKSCQKTKLTKTQLNAATDIDALYVPHKDLIIETNLVATTNRHYESISEQGLDLSDPKLLVSQSQGSKLHTSPSAIAGLLSSRAYGSAYFFAGTNRAPVAYAIEHFLCKDMEEINDTTIEDNRNRRDVDRSPGGSSTLYKNRCVGCHAGMDAMAGAFAYYDYLNGKVTYTPGNVVTKMNHNALFSAGYVTGNDSWINYWRVGQNAALGWSRDVTEGIGATSFGRMLADTEAFHSCMAKQAYEKVCMKKASANEDIARVARLTAAYKNSNFNMKSLFINAAIECLED
jgi:hypothetical protein